MTLTIAERDHLRAALTNMRRNADGRIQINPPTGVGRFVAHRNAQIKDGLPMQPDHVEGC